MTDVQTHFIELLWWTRNHGFLPRKPSGKEIYLDPITRRMCRHKDLKPHQHGIVLWVPSRKGLEDLGLQVRIERVNNLTIARVGMFEGAGPTEKEALLSSLNQARRALAA